MASTFGRRPSSALALVLLAARAARADTVKVPPGQTLTLDARPDHRRWRQLRRRGGRRGPLPDRGAGTQHRHRRRLARDVHVFAPAPCMGSATSPMADTNGAHGHGVDVAPCRSMRMAPPRWSSRGTPSMPREAFGVRVRQHHRQRRWQPDERQLVGEREHDRRRRRRAGHVLHRLQHEPAEGGAGQPHLQVAHHPRPHRQLVDWRHRPRGGQRPHRRARRHLRAASAAAFTSLGTTSTSPAISTGGIR